MLREPYTTDNWPKTDTGQLKVGKIEVLENITQLVEEFRPPLMALAEWADAKIAVHWARSLRFVNLYLSMYTQTSHRWHETGRFSITEPALQTINATPEFRHLFKSKVDHSLVVCDYGQIRSRPSGSVKRQGFAGSDRRRFGYSHSNCPSLF